MWVYPGQLFAWWDQYKRKVAVEDQAKTAWDQARGVVDPDRDSEADQVQD